MHKKFLGLSALMMAGVLAVSSVNLSALQVSAAEIEDTETLSEPSSFDEEDQKTEEKSEEKSEDETKEEEKKESATEEKELTEEKVEEIAEDKDEKSEPAEAEEASEVKEDIDEEKPEAEDFSGFGATTVIPKEDQEEPVPAPVSNLEFFNRWNQSDVVKGKITFNKQYNEYCYDLGETISVENLEDVVVTVKEQGGRFALKLYDDNMNELTADYNCSGSKEYSISYGDTSANIRYVGLMSMEEGEEAYPYDVVVTSIKANTNGQSADKNEKTIVYEGNDLKFVEHWDRTEVEGRTLDYEKEWVEYSLVLNEEIPADSLKSVTVTFEEATKSLGFKTYDDENNETAVTYGKNGFSKYTWNVTTDEPVCEFAMMAMNDQEYPFSVTVEKIEFVVDTTPAGERPTKGVEYDIVNLRDAVEELMGEDFIIGTAISYMEFADSMEMELVTKHFNGCTLGNELKPDSMIKESAPIVTYELNGEDISFPELNYSTPERYLDFFVDWNNEHPDKKIRIRGHVLVWHSQTPEFFFHEDYDESKPYVTPDVMNKRLEVYIREVAQHFAGAGSKYRDLFYGWDVVNEAVSDGTGTYRNGDEKSSWWKVYHSPEFITNAFVYANRYMPADIALFYNDYNETVSSKIEGICQLLQEVKATPGARIDGMGMQAHYGISNNDPSAEQIKKAALRYAQYVDQIQITELDFKGSSSSKDEQLAVRYKAVYDTVRRLKEEGVNVTGMTIWGVIDKDSWLQNQNNNGGGSDGKSKQYPLLFDDYYKAKNSFYAIAEAGELEPEIKNVILVQNLNNNFEAGNEYTFGKDSLNAKFVPLWSEGSVSVKVSVDDYGNDSNDSFTVYVDDGNGIKSETVKRADATETADGYEKVVTLKVDKDALSSNKVKMDVVVISGDKRAAFGDTKFNQYESSKYFAETVLKPLATISKGTVDVDGKADDEAWKNAKKVTLAINNGASVSADAKLLWDDENLYVFASVKDAVLNMDSDQKHEQDSLEVFIDENNDKTSSYQEDDKQYRINYANEHSFNGKKCIEDNLVSEVVLTDEGYDVEAAFKWTDVTPEIGSKIGLDLQINDANANGKRSGTLNWADKSGNGWSSTEVFGTVVLAEKIEETEKPQETTPTVEADKKVSVPTAAALVYTGSEQVGVAENEGYTVEGNKATDAGTYTATATLKKATRGAMTLQMLRRLSGRSIRLKTVLMFRLRQSA